MKITARQRAALIYTVLTTGATAFYCYQIAIGEVEPVFATWFLFSIAIGLSLWTYFRAKRSTHSLLTNIINVADLCFVSVIVIFVVIYDRGPTLELTKFHLFYGSLASVIIGFYLMSRNADAANIAVNLLLVVGYLPLYQKLIGAERNTESLVCWGVSFIAVVIGSRNAFGKEGDLLSKVYAIRAILCSAVVIVLIIRLELG